VAEDVFDFAPPPIKLLGAIGFLDSGTSVQDDRQSAFVNYQLAHFFAVARLAQNMMRDPPTGTFK
jgi:hypothetical protein